MFKFGAMGGTNPYNVAIPRPTHNVRFRKYDNESDEVNLQIGADGKYELFGHKHEFFCKRLALPREIYPPRQMGAKR